MLMNARHGKATLADLSITGMLEKRHKKAPTTNGPPTRSGCIGIEVIHFLDGVSHSYRSWRFQVRSGIFQ